MSDMYKALLLRGGAGGGGGGGGGSEMELWKTYTFDKKLFSDNLIQALPTFSTSSQTLVSQQDLDSLTLDFGSYVYAYYGRMLTIPEYNTTEKGSARQEYSWTAVNNYPTKYPVFPSVIDSVATYTYTNLLNGLNLDNGTNVYWKNASELAMNASASYGFYQYLPGFGIDSSTNALAVKSPYFYVRGNNTQLNQTYYNAVTDVRYQYCIDVYRVPKSATTQSFNKQIEHIIACVKSNDHKLT